MPSWEHDEIIALVKVKIDGYLTSLDLVDPIDQFKFVVSKWKKTSTIVMEVGHFTQLQNGDPLFLDFKHVHSYMINVG